MAEKGRILAVSALKLEEFVGGKITVASSYVKNGVIDKYVDGRLYITQRPGIAISQDASKTVTDARGRGVWRWSKDGQLYFINNATIYRGGYGTPLSPAGADVFAAGTQRCYFFEIGDYLVILDPENNTGWYINLATPTQYSKITDVDFPSNQTPPKTLALGGAVLNSRLYVMDTEGVIYGSNINDPTAWDPLNFITAEMDQDGGVILGKHHENLVAVGTRTIEFFYDAKNSVGSPLAPRLDLSYEIGAIREDTLHYEGGTMFFVGQALSGEIAAFAMTGFSVKKISTADLDSFLSTSVIKEGKRIMGSGFSAGGRVFYILTIYHLNPDIVPLTTLVYNMAADTWQLWDLEFTGIDGVPLVSWSESFGVHQGTGMLSNGDLVAVSDDFVPQDLLLSGGYVVSGYVEPGYVAASGASGTPVTMEVLHPAQDMGVSDSKFCHSVRFVGIETQNVQNLQLAWSDETNRDFTSYHPLRLDRAGWRVRRLGRFRRRAFKSQIQSTEQVFYEGLELEFSRGRA